MNPYKVREYQKNAYDAGNWNDAYEAPAKLQMNMAKHPDYPRVAWCSARHTDMIFTQPVVHEK